MTALTAAVAAALTLPAIAGAATVTVTGDAGSPVALTAGAPTALRQMNADVAVALAATEKRYSLSVAGPVAAAASPRTCTSSSVPTGLDYQGNGTYTISVTTYTDTACEKGAKPATYPIALNASSPLTPPPGVLLTRKPNDFSTFTHLIPIALNPGALTHEIRVAKGGVIGPDGGISGPSDQVYADAATGAVSLRLTDPGRYVMVARPQGFTGAAGQYFAPWSPAINVRAIAPFDFVGRPSFPDSRGPRYTLRVQLREKSARGKVKIKMARGKGRFRSIGKAKINRRGVFKKKFTQHKTGRYRIKFIYKGSRKVAAGKVTVGGYRIRRRSF